MHSIRKMFTAGLTSAALLSSMVVNVSAEQLKELTVGLENGTYATLAEAIAAATAGDTISLEAGTYSWDGVLEIPTAVNLAGAGVDETVLEGALSFADSAAEEQVSISDLTLRATEENKGLALSLSMDYQEDSTVTIQNTAFEGWQYGIDLSSLAEEAVLDLSRVSFTDVWCALSDDLVDSMGTLENVTTSQDYYAIRTSGQLPESEAVVDSYYASIASYQADQEFSFANPDLDGTAVTVAGSSADLAEALSQAQEGDTILVLPGIYDQAITISQSVHLIGQAAVMTADMNLGANVTDITIQGFTFENARIYGTYGNDNLTVRNNTFDMDGTVSLTAAIQINNDYTYSQEDVFQGRPVSGLTIQNNVFYGAEESELRTGGVLIGSVEGDTLVSDNRFYHMRNYYAFAIASSPDGNLTISGNVFSDWDGRQGDNPVNSAIYLGQRLDSNYEQIDLERQTTANIALSGNLFLFDEHQKGTQAINGEGLFYVLVDADADDLDNDELGVDQDDDDLGDNLDTADMDDQDDDLSDDLGDDQDDDVNLLVAQGIPHNYSLEGNYWGSATPDFAVLLPEITHMDLDNLLYYTDETMTFLSTNGTKAELTIVEVAKEILNHETLDNSQKADWIVSFQNFQKEEMMADSDLIDQLNALDAALLEEGNLTIENRITHDEAVEEAYQVITPAQVQGLALAVLAGSATETTATLGLNVHQTLGGLVDGASTAHFEISPFLHLDGGDEEEVSNSNVLTPVTFRLYLPASFSSTNRVTLTHREGDQVISEDVTYVVELDNGVPYILVTTASFSQFEVTYATNVSTGGGTSTPTFYASVNQPEHGTISISTTRPALNRTVTLTVTADEGYLVEEVIVLKHGTQNVAVTDLGNGKYTYVQPGTTVQIYATIVPADVDDVPEEEEVLLFEDVNQDDWFYEAVHFVYDKGWMLGVGDNQFAPSLTTSRGMITTMLHRISEEEIDVDSLNFSDVDADAWYAEGIAWAQANGIVEGYGDDSFGPNDAITREQMATILYRYASYVGYDMEAEADFDGFSDAELMSDYAVEALTWTVDRGLIGGNDDGTLNPLGNATRAEVATILMRFASLVESEEG